MLLSQAKVYFAQKNITIPNKFHSLQCPDTNFRGFEVGKINIKIQVYQ